LTHHTPSAEEKREKGREGKGEKKRKTREERNERKGKEERGVGVAMTAVNVCFN
jgi:hypothetical protein